MRPAPILILAFAMTASGCANAGAKLPVCDGKHLRPANPHGSVLDPTAPTTATLSPAETAAPANAPGCGR
jgi:hypothetical protein